MISMSELAAIEEFELSGGALCLDLANTLGDRPRSTSEHLHGYSDLLRWCRQAEMLDAEEHEALEREARAHPRRAEAVFEQAIELRETIFRIFAALAHDQQPEAEDIGALNSMLHLALPQLEIRSHQKGFDWCWGDCETALDRMLWPVVRSAADLLTSDEVTSLRECASETCGWLFVDRSRTRRRKWCDMAVCGNRAKARRHYQRSKQNSL